MLVHWTASPEQPYIVATTALMAGFDYAHVRLVVHPSEPDSLVEFLQESGRAGRDGKRLIYTCYWWMPPDGLG